MNERKGHTEMDQPDIRTRAYIHNLERAAAEAARSREAFNKKFDAIEAAKLKARTELAAAESAKVRERISADLERTFLLAGGSAADWRHVGDELIQNAIRDQMGAVDAATRAHIASSMDF